MKKRVRLTGSGNLKRGQVCVVEFSISKLRLFVSYYCSLPSQFHPSVLQGSFERETDQSLFREPLQMRAFDLQFYVSSPVRADLENSQSGMRHITGPKPRSRLRSLGQTKLIQGKQKKKIMWMLGG